MSKIKNMFSAPIQECSIKQAYRLSACYSFEFPMGSSKYAKWQYAKLASPHENCILVDCPALRFSPGMRS